jgi:23S rRNA pseudouridine2605 synthase
MARAGLCSRRDAEAWIEEGRVAVNGQIVTSPALNIGPQDTVLVDGEPLALPERTRLFLYHKPRGLVTTAKDPEGRLTIFDHLREHWPDIPRVVSVGRLDINTEGLLLLTNDGGLARILELPSTGWLRRYRVRANGETDQAKLDRLRDGIIIDGIDYAGIEAKLDRVQGANSWLTMGLREGKNREIKRVLEELGLAVNRLIRISFGPFQLLDLAEGAVEEVRTRILRDQLGPKLAKEAGVDFDGPSEPTLVQEDWSLPRKAPQGDKPRGRPPRILREDGTSERKPRKPFTPEEEQQPRVTKPGPGTRKHVSALRSATQAERKHGERKRVEHAETADRKGRAITVERVVSATRKPPAEEGPTRNARRFRAERERREGFQPERQDRAERSFSKSGEHGLGRRSSEAEPEAKAKAKAKAKGFGPKRAFGDKPAFGAKPGFGAKPAFGARSGPKARPNSAGDDRKPGTRGAGKPGAPPRGKGRPGGGGHGGGGHGSPGRSAPGKPTGRPPRGRH